MARLGLYFGIVLAPGGHQNTIKYPCSELVLGADAGCKTTAPPSLTYHAQRPLELLRRAAALLTYTLAYAREILRDRLFRHSVGLS